MQTDSPAPSLEVIGHTGRKLVLSAGEDAGGVTVGRLVDAAELLRSVLFEQLDAADRRLVVSLAGRGRP